LKAIFYHDTHREKCRQRSSKYNKWVILHEYFYNLWEAGCRFKDSGKIFKGMTRIQFKKVFLLDKDMDKLYKDFEKIFAYDKYQKASFDIYV
jgi:hypothetical protein